MIAGGFGALLALVAFASLLGGRRRELSIDVWIAIVATWLALLLLGRLNRAAPVARDRLRKVWSGRRKGRDTDRRTAQELVLEGLLISARDSERATSLRLRPRLAELAGHLLRTRHGIDLATDPQRAAERVGELFWLIDERDSRARSPSLDEIDRLLDILLDERTPR